MQIDPLKKETLTEQVMNQLAEKITSGSLAPGERLPDERSLATMFGVTRSRIREALRALSLVGLIDIRPGGGSFVSQRSGTIPREATLWSFHRELANYEDLYAARRLVETTVYLLCFDHKTPEVVNALTGYADKLLDLDIVAVSSEEFAQLIDSIDTYVGEHCGNGIFAKLMQTMLVLRYDSSLKILEDPSSRQSAILWRVKVLKAFAQTDRAHLESMLDSFYANSIQHLVDEAE